MSLRISFYFVALAAWATIFHSDIPKLVNSWNGEDYSHCYLILPIIGYLVWTNRGRIADSVGGSGFLGYLFLLVSIFFLFVGRFGSLRYFIDMSLWVALCGMALVALGHRAIRTLWLPMLIGVFAIPFPAFVDRVASFRLRLISSYLSEQVLRLLSIPVYRDGNVIDLGVIQLQVVDACSGLRYLWPSILMALLVGWFFLKAPWKRILLLLLSIPVTIFSNAFRIALTGVLTKFIDPALAEGFFHDFSGWLIYVVSLGVLWIITMLLASDSDKARREEQPVDLHRFKANLPAAWHGVIVLLLVVIMGVGPYFLKQKQYVPHRQRFAGFPEQVAGWQGHYSKLSEPVLQSLGLNDYINGQLSKEHERGHIWLLVSWYDNQTVEHAAHAPTSCLLGGGWDLLTKRVLPPVENGRNFPVTQMVLGKRGQKLISNFWLLQRGRVVTNEVLNKWFLVQDALTLQRTDGALVRIEMAVSPGETVDEVQAKLDVFAKDLRKDLTPYLPEDY